MRNSKTNIGNNPYLLDQKRKLDIKLIESKQELMTIDCDYTVKKDIFNRNKEYNQSLMSQVNKL